MRTTLLLAIGGAVAACALTACDEASEPTPAPEIFTHGVASGGVTERSAILWTRAAGQEHMTAEVATDAAFEDGFADDLEAETSAAADHTIQVSVTELEPATRYYYRFRVDGLVSDTGTFTTAPAGNVSAAVRFVFGGDADARRNPDGSPTYNEMEVLTAALAEDPAFFLFFGDTIYGDRDPAAFDTEGYRAKYRESRAYDALRSILAAAPVFVMWDDHEVVNDFDGETVDRARFEAGRQAFQEYWPMDARDDPARMYGSFRWGSELEVIVLDQRSFRSASAAGACTDGLQADPLPAGAFAGAPDVLATIRGFVGLPPGLPPGCVDALASPQRTILGEEQERFLEARLLASDARWKVIVNSVPVQEFYALPYDRWEGYPAARQRMLEFIRDNEIANVVFLTTDLHANLFGPVRMDAFSDEAPIAYEAVVGPIATDPLAQEIDKVIGAGGAAGFSALLTGVAKVDCAELSSYSYGTVAVDPAMGTMTIQAKDANGRVLCGRTLTAGK